MGEDRYMADQIDRGEETIPTEKLIELAPTIVKKALKCPQYNGTDTLVKNGNMGYNCKVVKCTVSAKKISGKNIVELFKKQLDNWKDKLGLVMSAKQNVKDKTGMGGNSNKSNHTGIKTVENRDEEQTAGIKTEYTVTRDRLRDEANETHNVTPGNGPHGTGHKHADPAYTTACSYTTDAMGDTTECHRTNEVTTSRATT